MIDQAVFAAEWRLLEERFAKSHTLEVVRRYHETLDPLLETEEFRSAARSLFAHARFFPAPADFLGSRCDGAWTQVQRCIAEFCPPEWRWGERWLTLNPTTKWACEQLGGIAGMKKASDRDVVQLRTTFRRIYVEAALSEAIGRPVPSNSNTPARLAAASADRRGHPPEVPITLPSIIQDEIR